MAAFSRTRSGRIFVSVGAGATGSLWVSDNWGQTWSATKAQPGSAVVDVFTLPETPGQLYAVTLAALQVSEDEGESWQYAPVRDVQRFTPARGVRCML